MIKNIDDIISLSDEINPAKPYFQMEGNNELILSGNNSILDYGTGRIRVNVDSVQLSVDGSQLTISYIDKSSITIRGEITNIGFAKVK